jgi:hypothetical protein
MLAAMLLVGAVVFRQQVVVWWQVVSINRDIDQLLTEPDKPEGKGAARIVGRLIPIDRQRKRVSNLYYDLPEEIRASSVDDAGTIAWLDEEESTTNNLSTLVCTLTLIDRDRKAVISTEVFRRIGTGDSSSLHKDIAEHLKKLPHDPRRR